MKYQVTLVEDTYDKLARKDILLNTVLYPDVEKALSDPRNTAWKNISKGIHKFRDENILVLSSPYFIMKSIQFKQKHYDLFFENLDIGEDYVMDLIKQVNLPAAVAVKKGEKPNFTPFRVLGLLMMKYLILHKREDDAKLVLSYLTFSLYHTLFSKYWGKVYIKEDVMRAMVNNLTLKSKLKALGSVEGMMMDTSYTYFDTYQARFRRCNDEDLWRSCDDLKTRQNNQWNKLVNAYMETKARNEAIGESYEEDDEGNYIETSGASNMVETLADQAQRLFLRGLNHKALSASAMMSEVPVTELRSAIEFIIMERQNKQVRNFYAALLTLYLNDTKMTATDISELRSLHFPAYMQEIYKKGNTKDVNIINIKKQSDAWLEVGCRKYKTSSSSSTKNNYRRAIFNYFTMVIMYS